MAEVPFEKKWPFVCLGFETGKQTGDERIGDCIFCGKPMKLYINENTGQWSCKGGLCAMEGNVYTFISFYYEDNCLDPLKNEGAAKKLGELALNRGIDLERIAETGIRWSPDDGKWVIPVRNQKGAIINLRFYSPGSKTIALTGMEVSLGGLETWSETGQSWPIYLCEGEWDALCMKLMLEKAEKQGTVLYAPGSDVFKKDWPKYFKGRDVIVCYDHDAAGERGTQKVFTKIKDSIPSFKFVCWPKELPSKFDIRDFYKRGGNYELLEEMLSEYESAVLGEKEEKVVYPKLRDGGRPSLADVFSIYRRYMEFTEDMEIGLKLIFAVSYAMNVNSLPIWMHFVAPPGGGKTELLMSLAGARNVKALSTVTSKSLVSGFSLPGGKDPSLLPQAFGKLMILKDYTEILQMNKGEREEVDSIFRGAYDGIVTKQFGNGITRHYEGSFNIVTGVTQEIFREAHTSLGERFLTFHMLKGVGFDSDAVIRAALNNSGSEAEMKREMGAAAIKFIEYSFDEEDIPPIKQEYLDRIVSLAQVVAQARAGVTRNYDKEIEFEPQHEVGTRLAKQLKILLICLGMCNDDFQVTEKDYEIIVRVALDSCKAFNLKVLEWVAHNEGKTDREIAEGVGIPRSTIRTNIENLVLLGALKREQEQDVDDVGRPKIMYRLTDFTKRHWINSKLLDKSTELKSEIPVQRQKFKKTTFKLKIK